MNENTGYFEHNIMSNSHNNIMKRNTLIFRLTVLSLASILFVTSCSNSYERHSLLDPTPDTAEGRYQTLPDSGSSGIMPERATSNAEMTILGDMQADESVENPQVDPADQRRLVVYTAVINVVVERISDSIERIENLIVDMGGYMQEMSSDSITLKVPADKFQDAIAEVEKLGEVTRRDIKGTDVTEQMRDLDIRLKNSEQARERMINLLERAETVEEILKIEKELERITETIEMLKGKISYLNNKINFSTLTVRFNSPLPQEDLTLATPFIWLQSLGSEMTRPVRALTSPGSSFLGIFEWSNFKLPDGYIKYYEDENRTRAMSADSVMVHMHQEKNYKGGNVDFWSSLVRRVLVEQKVIHIDEQSELKLDNKKEAVLFLGSKQIGSQQYGYLCAIASTKDNVYVFESWGPMAEFEKDEAKLRDALKSMKTK